MARIPNQIQSGATSVAWCRPAGLGILWTSPHLNQGAIVQISQVFHGMRQARHLSCVGEPQGSLDIIRLRSQDFITLNPSLEVQAKKATALGGDGSGNRRQDARKPQRPSLEHSSSEERRSSFVRHFAQESGGCQSPVAQVKATTAAEELDPHRAAVGLIPSPGKPLDPAVAVPSSSAQQCRASHSAGQKRTWLC